MKVIAQKDIYLEGCKPIKEGTTFETNDEKINMKDTDAKKLIEKGALKEAGKAATKGDDK